jgi:phage gpG-like protein
MAMIEDKQLLKSIAQRIHDNIKDRIRHNQIKPATKNKEKGKATLTDTNKLFENIIYEIKDDSIHIGVNLNLASYARIHQEGGTIVPQKAKYLAIPLCPEAKIAKSPNNIELEEGESTFIAKSIIFKNYGKEKKYKIKPLYKLEKSVKIPARPYLFLDDRDKSQIENIVKNYYDKKIRKAFNGS